MGYLSADDLLAGSAATHDIEIPAEVLAPGRAHEAAGSKPAKLEKTGLGMAAAGVPAARVRLRPLTVRDIQKMSKAAKDNDSLLSILMIKESLQEPVMTFEQVHALHAGLARFLLDEVHRVSGLGLETKSLAEVVEAPLAKACFVLAKEFGWSPEEVGNLTMGQILFYLEMLRQNKAEAAA